MKVFKTIDGCIIDVVKHTLDVLNTHPDVEVFIGTDSQNCGYYTKYSTVIAYRYGHRGVHYIFNVEKVNRIKDMWTRLWDEAVRSIEIADWFTEKIKLKVQIDMDYNEDKFAGSNKLISAAKGWATSIGYKVNTKPQCLIACKAADYHCR